MVVERARGGGRRKGGSGFAAFVFMPRMDILSFVFSPPLPRLVPSRKAGYFLPNVALFAVRMTIDLGPH